MSIAVAVTAKLKEHGRRAAAGEGKATDEARLVVFGTPLFADNQQLAQSRLNGDLFLNAVGWLVGQEELVSIRSRSVRASRAELTPDQAGQRLLPLRAHHPRAADRARHLPSGGGGDA